MPEAFTNTKSKDSANHLVKVLVVDDDEQLRTLISWDFGHQGYTVTSAANGKEALEHCLSNEIDLIVSDICMPVMDGIELVKELRARDPKKPAIFLITGFSTIEPNTALQLGANRVFFKPYDRKELFSAIQETLRS